MEREDGGDKFGLDPQREMIEMNDGDDRYEEKGQDATQVEGSGWQTGARVGENDGFVTSGDEAVTHLEPSGRREFSHPHRGHDQTLKMDVSNRVGVHQDVSRRVEVLQEQHQIDTTSSRSGPDPSARRKKRTRAASTDVDVADGVGVDEKRSHVATALQPTRLEETETRPAQNPQNFAGSSPQQTLPRQKLGQKDEHISRTVPISRRPFTSTRAVRISAVACMAVFSLFSTWVGHWSFSTQFSQLQQSLESSTSNYGYNVPQSILGAEHSAVNTINSAVTNATVVTAVDSPISPGIGSGLVMMDASLATTNNTIHDSIQDVSLAPGVTSSDAAQAGTGTNSLVAPTGTVNSNIPSGSLVAVANAPKLNYFAIEGGTATQAAGTGIINNIMAGSPANISMYSATNELKLDYFAIGGGASGVGATRAGGFGTVNSNTPAGYTAAGASVTAFGAGITLSAVQGQDIVTPTPIPTVVTASNNPSVTFLPVTPAVNSRNVFKGYSIAPVHSEKPVTINIASNDSCALGETSLPWPLYRVGDNLEYGVNKSTPDVTIYLSTLLAPLGYAMYDWGKTASLKDEEFLNTFRFYMYDELDDPIFNTKVYEVCFTRTYSMPVDPRTDARWWETIDEKMSILMREYCPEMTMMDALRHHPLRTRIPSEASLFVIGYFPTMAYHGNPCSEVGTIEEGEQRVINFLINNLYYRRNGGKDHLFVFAYYNYVIGSNLSKFLDHGPMIAANERFLFMMMTQFPRLFSGVDEVIVIPYVSSPFIDTDDLPGNVSIRKPNFFFRGNMVRRGVGSERGRLLDLAQILPGADIGDVRPNLKNRRYPLPFLIKQTYDLMLQTDICLVPEGDTPTSLRLFEALAAGCVPVVLARKLPMSIDLPFPNLIDWDSIVYFTHSIGDIVNCETGIQQLAKTLLGLVSTPEAQKVLKEKRRKGIEVFREYFSTYRNPQGMVSGTLYETWRLQKRRGTLAK